MNKKQRKLKKLRYRVLSFTFVSIGFIIFVLMMFSQSILEVLGLLIGFFILVILQNSINEKY